MLEGLRCLPMLKTGRQPTAATSYYWRGLNYYSLNYYYFALFSRLKGTPQIICAHIVYHRQYKVIPQKGINENMKHKNEPTKKNYAKNTTNVVIYRGVFSFVRTFLKRG